MTLARAVQARNIKSVMVNNKYELEGYKKVSEGYLFSIDKRAFWLLIILYTSLILFISGCFATIVYFTYSIEVIWSAITGLSTLILAAVTGTYVCISYKNISEMRKARHADFLPIIEINYHSLDHHNLKAGFTLKNIGKGPALKISTKYAGQWRPTNRRSLAPTKSTNIYIKLNKSKHKQLITVRSFDIFGNKIYSWIVVSMQDGIHDLVCESWEFGSSPEGFIE